MWPWDATVLLHISPPEDAGLMERWSRYGGAAEVSAWK